MSGNGKCDENAAMESLCRSFEVEWKKVERRDVMTYSPENRVPGVI